MSPTYIYDEAQAQDEKALRNLAHSVGMTSSTIRLAYRRDPDYFHGLCVEGRDCQVVTVRCKDSGEIVACGSRALRPVWINGKEQWAGYYGGLRIHSKHRKGTVLSRGYRHHKKLHGDGRVLLYTTTILEENKEALQVLTTGSGRAGLPTYSPLGRYLCQAVVLGGKPRKVNSPLVIRQAKSNDAKQLINCLRRNGSRRQFAPAWDLSDFDTDSPVTRGLSIEDFLVALNNDEVVGCVARWDQSAFKQTIVEGYGGLMPLLRPIWDLLAPLLGYRRLPSPGKRLPYFFAACPAIDDDNPKVFRALIETLRNSWLGSKYAYFVIGLHEDDPLRVPLKELRPSFTYSSCMFVVTWEDGAKALASLDRRVPYLEAGTL